MKKKLIGTLSIALLSMSSFSAYANDAETTADNELEGILNSINSVEDTTETTTTAPAVESEAELEALFNEGAPLPNVAPETDIDSFNMDNMDVETTSTAVEPINDTFFNDLESNIMSNEVVIDRDEAFLTEPEPAVNDFNNFDENTVDTTYVAGGKGATTSGRRLTATGFNEFVVVMLGLLASGGIYAYRRKQK